MATAMNKDGPALCEQFSQLINRIEERYHCIIIYFTTDGDGGSSKGRKLLGFERLYLLVPACWAHQVMEIIIIISSS